VGKKLRITKQTLNHWGIGGKKKGQRIGEEKRGGGVAIDLSFNGKSLHHGENLTGREFFLQTGPKRGKKGRTARFQQQMSGPLIRNVAGGKIRKADLNASKSGLWVKVGKSCVNFRKKEQSRKKSCSTNGKEVEPKGS